MGKTAVGRSLMRGAGQSARSPAPKPAAYIMVRDAHGNPNVDDPHGLPQQLRDMLTPHERVALGIPEPGDI
jgi:hypothetical protein